MRVLPRQAALGLLGLLLFVASAHAHSQEDTRRVLLQISPTGVDLVVHWTMATGVEAADYRARLDANRDGRLVLPGERLGQAQLLMPRLQKGLTVWLDDQQLEFTVAQVAFKDAKPFQGERTGFEGLVLFRSAVVIDRPRAVVIALGDGPPITVEAQGKALVLSGDLPVRAGDPVLGPLVLGGTRPQISVQVVPTAPAVPATPARPIAPGAVAP
jgi:hypothetical protein